MQQNNWKRGLGIGLMLLLASGCEDPVIQVPVTGASASPGSDGSGSNGSGSGSSSPSPRPTVGVPGTTPGTTPGATPTPGRSTSPSPTVSSSPSITTPASLIFDQPTVNSDFNLSNIPIKVRAEVPLGVSLKELTVFYDGTQLFTQTSSSGTLNVPTWNPHVKVSIQNKDLSPVPYGNHKLTARAVTAAGVESTLDFEFTKPLLFRGWTEKVKIKTSAGDKDAPLPLMQTALANMKVYGFENRIFSFFGETKDGKLPPTYIQTLNLDRPDKGWEPMATSSLTPRRRFALAGLGRYTYLIGGRLTDVSAAISDKVEGYDIVLQRAVTAPALPAGCATTDAAAAVLDNFLYVVGGETTTGISGQTLRLELTAEGLPKEGATWQTMTKLPNSEVRRGSVLVAHQGALYLIGGEDSDGIKSFGVLRYKDNAWTDSGLLPRAVSYPAAAVLGDDIYVVGGLAGVRGSETYISDVVRYAVNDSGQGTNNRLDGVMELSSGRIGMGWTVVNNQLFLLGGLEQGTDVDGNGNPIDKVLSVVIRADSL